LALGCSDLDDPQDTWCLTEGQGVGDCVDPEGQVDGPNPWSCLGQAAQEPTFVPARPAGLVLPVLEWSSRASLMDQGLTATLCRAGDWQCLDPINDTPIPIRTGVLGSSVQLPPFAAGVPVAEGFDGFIRFDVDPGNPATPDEQRYVSTFLYLTGPIAKTVTVGPPILMFQRRTGTRGHHSVPLACLAHPGRDASG
jgi:hypothetical protein